MFGNKDKLEVSAPDSQPVRARSHIAHGMFIQGDIEGDIDLLLEGRLEGNVRCRSITIGRTGEVIGRVVAHEAILDGKVVGDIEAKSVKLNQTAQMIGDVRHEVIEVASGACIEGHYGRIDAKPAVKSITKTAAGRVVQSPGNTPPKAPSAGPAKSDLVAVSEVKDIAGVTSSDDAKTVKIN